MRQILIISIITISSLVSLLAQTPETKIKWYTLKEALELEKQQPRKIIIDIYTDWCGWCKRMDAETFNHPVIAEYLSKNFYPVKFNAESTEPVEFNGQKFINPGGGRSVHEFAAALFKTQKLEIGYPCIAYLNENMQLLIAVPGYWEAKRIEPLLSYIVEEKFKLQPFDDYQKSFVSKIK
jgi:thioredoxin-related protein